MTMIHVYLVIALTFVCCRAWKYSIEYSHSIAEKQKHYLLDAWLVKNAWMNPSMCRDPNDPTKIVIVWRMPDRKKADKIGYMWLNDKTMQSTKSKDMIELYNAEPNSTWRTNLVGEDARIFNHNGALWAVYNQHLTRYKKLYYSKLFYDAPKDMFYSLHPINHVTFEKEKEKRHQKNWSPFDFCPQCTFNKFGYVVKSNTNTSSGTLPTSGAAAELIPPPSSSSSSYYYSSSSSSPPSPLLLFIYTIQPHVIVEALPVLDEKGEMNARTVFSTEMQDFTWKWGTMRGGTPALRINTPPSELSPGTGTGAGASAGTGTPAPVYLTFFHSSTKVDGQGILTYFTGAYVFESSPPFAITHVTPEPILHKSFFNETIDGWAFKYVDFINFPMGFVMCDRFIHLSYGRNDRDGYILKLEREPFLKSLVPVKSRVVGRSEWEAGSGRIKPDTYHTEP